MKKIKISELPPYNSLKGLFTLGTDKDNRSVKVSLEFIETTTEAAVQNANSAAASAESRTTAAISQAQADVTAAVNQANTATTNANNKATAAQQAATSANNAAASANSAAQTATASATAADQAKAAALTAKQQAETATTAAQEATAAANQAKEDADEATSEAQGATAETIEATSALLNFLGSILPTALTVEDVPRLTVGNVYPVFIKAVLSPSGVRQNIIFISDNKAVTVAPDGRLRIVGSGRSVVQVIPTINTSLAKVIEVVVGEPTVRFVNTRTRLRLTASGALRMN